MVHINYISLVNLTVDAPVVKELLQNDFTAETMEAEFANITTNESYRRQMLQGYDQVIDIMGHQGASERTAQTIIQTATK